MKTHGALLGKLVDMWGRLGKTDLEILGGALQGKDAGEEYLQGRSTYAWYHAIALWKQPRVVAEIGVRFGYSMKAMVSAVAVKPVVYGFDNECYEPGCLAIARENVGRYCRAVGLRLVKQDTQELSPGGLAKLGLREVDLFHVDGDHSYAGALRDLGLALETLDREGVMLVDDIAFLPPVKHAADDFAERHGLWVVYLPTYRGMYVMGF